MVINILQVSLKSQLKELSLVMCLHGFKIKLSWKVTPKCVVCNALRKNHWPGSVASDINFNIGSGPYFC